MKRSPNLASLAFALAFAGLLAYFGSGDRPWTLAAWLAPAFLLRVTRHARWWAWPLVLLVMSTAIFFAFREMAPMPPVILVISVVLGTAIELVPFAADRALHRRLPPFAATLLLPAAMTALAWLGSLTPNGTWGNIAYAAGQPAVLAQLVSVTGVWGLVFLPYWVATVVNGVLDAAAPRDDARTARGIAPAAATLGAVLVAVTVYGFARLATAPAGTPVTLAAITPTAADRDLVFEAAMPVLTSRTMTDADRDALLAASGTMADALFAATEAAAAAGAAIVGWSETAHVIIDGEARPERDAVIARAAAIAAEHDAYIAMGLGIVDEAALVAGDGPFVRNVLVVVGPDGRVALEHLKCRLVPGTPEAAISVRGDGVLQVADTPHGTITGAVCYDFDFPDVIRPAGRARADLLVAPSNDWPAIRHMHATMARFRAIETGAALLRPTSNGLSVIADSRGRTIATRDWTTDGGGTLRGEVTLAASPTLSTRIGAGVAQASAIGTVLLVIVGFIRRRDASSSRAAPASAPGPDGSAS